MMFILIIIERVIRQEREEKRILRQEHRQKEAELNAEANKNYLNKNNKGREFTISIAIPGSIIGKVQSRELKTYVAGQVNFHIFIVKLIQYAKFLSKCLF